VLEDRPPSRIDVPALYAEHWRACVRLAVLLVDERAAAEDVVQDAFVALYQRQASLRDPAAALAYLRACIVNLCRSVIRRRQTARRHLAVAERDIADSADVGALLSAEHQRMLTAVRVLPLAQREVVVLRYWAQLSEAEIAAALGISQGTVKSQASRALAQLRIKMEHHHD
jgi:RNA polymerase sigma-70 factor (sigma-E family)